MFDISRNEETSK